MPGYVAFQAGINLGIMAGRRDTFEARGFANVGTIIASGNVLFGHARAPNPLARQLGYRSKARNLRSMKHLFQMD
jgi:uncharacterized protein (DUF1697 family)